jgi:hypothetical protein
MKAIENAFDSRKELRELAKKYGVSKELTVFHFARFYEFCIGRSDIAEHNLIFFRVSRDIFDELCTIALDEVSALS